MATESKRISEHRKARLQELLEMMATKANDGECMTYPYCRYCREPEKLIRKSQTPCADAEIARRAAAKRKYNTYRGAC